MPQMAPMMWFYLMIYSLFMVAVVLFIIYFIPLNNSMINTNINKTNKKHFKTLW